MTYLLLKLTDNCNTTIKTCEKFKKNNQGIGFGKKKKYTVLLIRPNPKTMMRASFWPARNNIQKYLAIHIALTSKNELMHEL